MNRTEDNEPNEVKWDNAPLDVSLEKHGYKKPDRMVKGRGQNLTGAFENVTGGFGKSNRRLRQI